MRASNLKFSNAERELKLGVPSEDFGRLLQDAVVLFHPEQTPQCIFQRTTYFDTDDLALKDAGVSVRLREADGETIQSIKAMHSTASSGAAVRGEWEWPVKSKALDQRRLNVPPLRHLMPRIRANGLKPIFRTEVERTKMNLMAEGERVELAFDRGHVIAGSNKVPVAEVEIELKQGHNSGVLYSIGLELHKQAHMRMGSNSKAVLGYRMLEANGPRSSKMPSIELNDDVTIADAFVQIMRQSIGHMMVNQPAALEASAEGVHRFRIAIRHVRTALKLFAEYLGDVECEALQKELQWLGREIGEARDWDAFVTNSLPLHLSDDMVADTVAELSRTAHERAAAVLQSDRYTRLMLSLGQWLESGGWRTPGLASAAADPDEPLDRFAGALLDRIAQKVLEAGQGVKKLDAPQRHRLRKRVKKLRYSVEFLASQYGEKEVAAYVKRLKKLQRILGDLNDEVVAGALLMRVGAPPSMRDALGPECEDRLGDLPKAWKRFSREEPFWNTTGCRRSS